MNCHCGRGLPTAEAHTLLLCKYCGAAWTGGYKNWKPYKADTYNGPVLKLFEYPSGWRPKKARPAKRQRKPREHGTRACYAAGCREPECKAANARNSLEYKRKRLERVKEHGIPGHVDHGSYSTYTNWGCKCTPCRKASNKMGRKARARRAENTRLHGLPEHVQHGTVTAYEAHGCRCAPCIKASLERRLDYVNKRIERERQSSAS